MKKALKTIIISLLVFSFISSGMCCALADENVYTIDNYVLVDNEYATFTIKRIEIDSFWGTEFKILLENKTNKNLMFSIDRSSVNGYSCDPFWASEVPAGKKENTEITFYNLEEYNITTIEKWRFELSISDSDDWFADPYVKEVYTVFPTGLDDSTVVIPERRQTATEKVIYKDDRIEFTILDSSVDDLWGYELNCYLENKTDRNIMFSWDDVSVNGFMCDPFWGTEIPAQTKAYSSISFYDSLLEENDMTYDDIEDIEFKLRISDADDWMADSIVENIYTYSID